MTDGQRTGRQSDSPGTDRRSDDHGRIGSPLRPTEIAPGTNVLVAGPAMTEKRRVLFDLLAGATDGSIVLVTTKQSADSIRTAYAAGGTREPTGLMVIDCVSRQRGVGTVRDTDAVRYVGSAGDLTGIGIALSGVMREFYHDPSVDVAGVGLHSLATMLMYADIRRVFQFVHVITGRIESSGFVGAFTLDTALRDDKPVDRLKGLFDALIEVRETEAAPELRVRGGSFGPRRWTTF